MHGLYNSNSDINITAVNKRTGEETQVDIKGQYFDVLGVKLLSGYNEIEVTLKDDRDATATWHLTVIYSDTVQFLSDLVFSEDYTDEDAAPIDITASVDVVQNNNITEVWVEKLNPVSNEYEKFIKLDTSGIINEATKGTQSQKLLIQLVRRKVVINTGWRLAQMG